jgi:hypothetical protein
MRGRKKLTAQQARGVQRVVACEYSGDAQEVLVTTEQGRTFRVPIKGVVNDWATRLKWAERPAWAKAAN